jgi:hypothetical protein
LRGKGGDEWHLPEIITQLFTMKEAVSSSGYNGKGSHPIKGQRRASPRLKIIADDEQDFTDSKFTCHQKNNNKYEENT